MDKQQLKHERKELRMAKGAKKHAEALRKIADRLEDMHVKIPGINSKSAKRK